MSKSSNQKIFDIIPPKKIGEKVLLKKEIREKEPFRAQPGKFPWKIFLTIAFTLILGGASFYFIFQKAEIIIWPETEIVELKEKVTVDAKVSQVDLSTNSIPGDILKEEQRTSQEFSSSGKATKEKKAEGTIRVYNAYSTSPQVLIATTRFVSSDGKLFRSLSRVTIPGGTYKGGKLEPGFLDIQVQADQPGEECNIGPSTFSIPGFAGTPRFTAFYGKSFEPMQGGFKGETFQVDQQDLEKAEAVLKEKLLEAVKIPLKSKVPGEIIILEEASTKEFSTPVFSAEAGDEKASFVGEGQLSFKALAFNKSDLENFVKEYIIPQISKDQKIDSKNLEINYSIETVNIDQAKMVLSLDIKAKIYFGISEEEIKKEITGKPIAEAKEFLDKDPRITKLEINLWPFWLKKVPQSAKKIKIEQRIDGSISSPSTPQ